MTTVYVVLASCLLWIVLQTQGGDLTRPCPAQRPPEAAPCHLGFSEDRHPVQTYSDPALAIESKHSLGRGKASGLGMGGWDVLRRWNIPELQVVCDLLIPELQGVCDLLIPELQGV